MCNSLLLPPVLDTAMASDEAVTIVYGADGFGEPLGKELIAYLQSKGKQAPSHR